MPAIHAAAPEPRIAVDIRCELGEGPIWNPARGSLMWVDILRHAVFEADADGKRLRSWGFAEPVSALGWIDARRVAVAGASGVTVLDLLTNARTPDAALEAENPATRSNDGRVAPDGAFWVGTMGRQAEPKAGALYRVADGQVERLLGDVSIPNSTCFSPDGRRAYFADSLERRILVLPLDAETGRPNGAPDLFVDLSAEGLAPDGSVIDREGCLWNAQWGAGRVARYRPNGRLDRVVALPARQVTCPCFGGRDLGTLFVTSAAEGMTEAEREAEPLAGAVFAIDLEGVKGLPEARFAKPAFVASGFGGSAPSTAG